MCSRVYVYVNINFMWKIRIEGDIMESYPAEKGRMVINLERQATIERKGEKREMPFEYGFYELFLIFFFWGIAGWVVEGIDMRIEAGEFQNRGFLHMPLPPHTEFRWKDWKAT